MSILVSAVFVLWFAATLIYQFTGHPFVGRAKQYDFFGLVPHYRVFGRPAKNLTLYYRFSGTNDWTQISTARTFRWWNLFFYPQVYSTKALWHYLQAFSISYAQNSAVSPDSISYQTIAELVEQQSPNGHYYKFQVREDEETIFCSEFRKRKAN